MQKEYKNAMEKISLLDEDKARILANVKKAYEQSGVASDDAGAQKNIVPFYKRPRFSARRWGTVAAAFAVICTSAVLIYNQFTGDNRGGGYGIDYTNPTMQPVEEVVWQELDSVEDIAEKTDCQTYTLNSVSKKYKVKKVEVAPAQKHVRITYKNKKDEDRILFEYKEEENAEDITKQFENESELAKEKVGTSDVTMYGTEKCDAMTWQQESCTFAVRMSKGCSTEKAKSIVSGTKKKDSDDKHGKDNPSKGKGNDSSAATSPNAVGWKGNEKPSSTNQKKKILREIYNRLGFRITIGEPAEDVTYKKIDDFESFAFYYNENEDLEGNRIVGYAGWEGCPSGVMKHFNESDIKSVNGVSVTVYEKENGERLFAFIKQEISFTILIENWTGEDMEEALGEILSVIHISMDDGDSGDDKDEKTEKNDKDEEDAAPYREAAQEIQDAVAEKSLKTLASYVEFPLQIKGAGVDVESAKEFQELSSDAVFASDWVDAVVSYDISKIKADTKSFKMGDSSNYLLCKIKNGSVVITELCTEKALPQPEPSADGEY